jgi:hypothetical protein
MGGGLVRTCDGRSAGVAAVTVVDGGRSVLMPMGALEAGGGSWAVGLAEVGSVEVIEVVTRSRGMCDVVW